MESTSSDVAHDGSRRGQSHIKALGREAEKVSFCGETAMCQVLAITALPFVEDIGSSINPDHRRCGRIKVNFPSRDSDEMADEIR